jgi:UDP-N-acetylglucosamine:LPS N-acetylglucosamine transferase
MFGGYGSRVMRNIACQLPDTQLILLCGHNRALADRLRATPAAAPRLVVEFTSDVAYYMQISDFFIGKPGPGSLSEALQLGLPPIVVRDAWTMPQERYNTEWIRDHGAGIVLPSFRHIRKAVLDLMARHAEFHANIRRLQNRAIYEIPVVLGRILESAERRSAPTTCPVNVQLDGRLMDTHSAY